MSRGRMTRHPHGANRKAMVQWLSREGSHMPEVSS